MNRVLAVRRGPLLLIVVLAALLGLWMAAQRATQGPSVRPAARTLALPGAQVYAEPRPLAPFHLVDHRGQVFDLARLRGRWSFLFLGYLNCPDLCPMTLSVLQEVERRLAGSGTADTQFVFVSVDPKRDKPQDLATYVTYFHPDFVGVTGAPQELAALARQLGVFYREAEPHGPDRDGEGYAVEHSGSVLLVDPRGRLYAVFPAPHRASTVSATYLELRRRAQPGPGVPGRAPS